MPSNDDGGAALGSLAARLLGQAAPTYAASDNHLIYANKAFLTLAADLFPGERVFVGGEAPEALREVFERLDRGEAEIHRRESVGPVENPVHLRSIHAILPGAEPPTGVDQDAQPETVYTGAYTNVTLEAQAVIRSSDAQTRYQDLLRSTSDWVWETDASMNITMVSDRVLETLGRTPSSLVGIRLFDLGHFERIDRQEEPRMGPIARRAPFRNLNFLMPAADKSLRRVSLSGVPRFNPDSGRFEGYRGTGTDVTKQHDAEERASRSQAQLEASLRALRERNKQLDDALSEAQSAAIAKTEFLSKMSHELRTPLNAIIGFADMAKTRMHGDINDRYHGYFTDIGRAADHLLHIINDILDSANLDTRETTIEAVEVDIGAVIAEARQLIAPQAAEGGVDISAVAAPPDRRVVADIDRMRQILINLLGNAVKFTGTGGSVGVDIRDAENGMLDITVWDTGIGISPADQVRIFERFQQLNADVLARTVEGIGLGLTISRELAQLMKGNITVDSAPGRGSRFTLTLPRHERLARVGE